MPETPPLRPAGLPPAARAPLLPAVLLLPSAFAWLGLGFLSLLWVASRRSLSLTDYFLLRQDALALTATAVLLLGLRIASPAGRVRFGMAPPRIAVPAICLAVLAVGVAGWPLVFQGRPLSMDEFWAGFDAEVFRRGRFAAPVPDAWRPYVPALQPMWRVESRDNSVLLSTYLPVNAMARALFSRVGVGWLASPAWAAIGCAALYANARRLWPERRGPAWVALVMAASSSQLLVTAMTPYAMSAHFALNMVWLRLFLVRRPWAHLLALLIGGAACGLHQLIFHLLFAGPFVLELWLGRRWRAAGGYTLGYAAISLLWMSYGAWLLPLAGAAPAVGGEGGATSFLARAAGLAAHFDFSAFPVMAQNLLRFIAWQNPLLVPLAIVGAPLAFRTGGVLRPLLVGAVATLAAMLVLLPYQGHGWGYRYLHGELGALALVAAAGWVALTDAGRPGGVWTGARTSFAICTLFAALVLLPLHALQARSFAAPYARAQAVIESSGADTVLVDATGVWFGDDFVRNDPFLAKPPKVMQLGFLSPGQVRALCASRSLALFDHRAAAAAGVPTFPQETQGETRAARHVLETDPACRAVRRL